MKSVTEAITEMAAKHNLRADKKGRDLALSRKAKMTLIKLVGLDNESAFVFLVCRSSSCDLPGERTGIHDVFSVTLALHLRQCQNSYNPGLWDVFNPAVQVPKTEVYARYITLDQPHRSLVYNDKKSLSELTTLCDQVWASFECLFPRLFTWERFNDQDYIFRGYAERWTFDISRATGAYTPGIRVADDERIQYNQRWGPDWLYFRSIRT